ncbi:hypothetical protein BV22DRAFT_1058849 [Leucogyrophana mollusca]|uniref:Uncharacterized protein n=1 Tax=Leucogyrophana mollusca TaxID=85980 RepID=A0ACB8BSW4_9AGAM|nr:hypothetical protein BV22DRAFT_1058849 [Leucogyrophana mollusca]
MLYHASRLLTSTTVSAVPPLSAVSPFTDILHSAAARAWTRRAQYHDASRVVKKRPQERSEGSSSCRAHPRPPAPTKAPGRFGVTSINPDSLSDYDTSWRDPGRTSSFYEADPPWHPSLSVHSRPIQTLPVPSLPIPTSRESFHQNLLDIISHQPSSLSTLLQYHSLYPPPFHSFHSTRSFNLLISLAFRHAALGTAGRLFNDMRSEGIRGDMETWKLIVRWFVRTGRWNEAWRRVMRILENKKWKEEMNISLLARKGIPLPLWLEFFGTMKRGALRRLVKRRSKRVKQGWVDSSQAYKVLHEFPGIHSTDPGSARYQTLMDHFPSLTSHEYAQLPPKAVYTIVHAMIRLGRRQDALTTTQAYLSSLPRRLAHSQRRVVRDIIHLHILVDPAKSGLSHHFASRRVLYALLDMRKDILPSPTTLFLLLGTLRTCKRCGTIAGQCLRIFRRRWGERVESGMVRRRIASLALKEGRSDIFDDMIRKEQSARSIRAGWRTQRELLGGSFPRAFPRLIKRPHRQLFGKRGIENRRWQMLTKNALRMRQRRGGVGS